MRQWRQSMRSNTSADTEGSEPITSPRTVRLAWAKWLKEGGDIPYPNMPFWMVPPCLRKQVHQRKEKMETGEYGSSEEMSGEAATTEQPHTAGHMPR